MVHDDCALLVVDLGVQPRVADEVNDPLLGCVSVQAQAGAEVLERNAGMDLAVALEDEVAGRVDKVVGVGEQEEVAAENLLGQDKLALSLLEVEVDAEGVHEPGDGVLVLVGLLLNDADDVLHLLLVDAGILRAPAVRDDSDGQVAQDPRAVSLDAVNVAGVEEQLEDGLAGLLGVEQGEEDPVDESGPVLQLGQRVLRQPRVDRLAHLLHLLHGRLPVHGQGLAGQAAPRRGRHFVVVGGEHAEAVQHLRGVGVVAAAVLEVAEVVEGVDHLDGDLESLVSKCLPFRR